MESLHGSSVSQVDMLAEILETVKSLQKEYQKLSSTVEAINGRVNVMAGIQHTQRADPATSTPKLDAPTPVEVQEPHMESVVQPLESLRLPASVGNVDDEPQRSSLLSSTRRQSITSRIILTTYPGQSGIDPVIMRWGHPDPRLRGPVIVSRNQSTIRRRNGMLTHSFAKGYEEHICRSKISELTEVN